VRAFCKEEMKQQGEKLSGHVVAMAETVLVAPSDEVSDEAAQPPSCSRPWHGTARLMRDGLAREKSICAF